MQTIDAATMRQMLNAMADKIVSSRDRLNEIDAGIGDADHGTGMAQSFAKARDKLAAVEEEDISKELKAFGMGILGGGGGASGALFSGLFTEGGKLMSEKKEMTPAELASWWQAGLAMVVARGKAKAGDKTMVDALEPAVAALIEDAPKGFGEQLSKALEAARTGVEATKNMIGGQGRSRYAGERSLGHQDAGATSVALLFEAMVESVK